MTGWVQAVPSHCSVRVCGAVTLKQDPFSSAYSRAFQRRVRAGCDSATTELLAAGAGAGRPGMARHVDTRYPFWMVSVIELPAASVALTRVVTSALAGAVKVMRKRPPPSAVTAAGRQVCPWL